VESEIGYTFKDKNLLRLALTHRSYLSVDDKPAEYQWVNTNERLEFLGDSVLGNCMSHHLYEQYKNHQEGELSKLKSLLVSAPVLFECAAKIHLGSYLFLSPGEVKSGGRTRPSILADAFEAVIGAVYLDGGLVNARNFIHRALITQADIYLKNETLYNYKSELLEMVQALGRGSPNYKVVHEFGPEHDKTFKINVEVRATYLAEGVGKTKKSAEQDAARLALSEISKFPDLLGDPH